MAYQDAPIPRKGSGNNNAQSNTSPSWLLQDGVQHFLSQKLQQFLANCG